MYAMLIGLVVVLQVLVLGLLWKVFQEVRGRRRLKEGDLVLYVNPQGNDGLNNAITRVLGVNARHGTVQIRAQGTTALVPMRRLQLLHIHPNAPIQVPEEALPGGFGQGEGRLRWNQAKFRVVPLEWFDYLVPVKKSA